jgi:acyl-CoA thioester hydrolase
MIEDENQREERSMATVPKVFRTNHRIKFSDLDPYNHMTSGQYAIYYVDHRMQGLKECIGWGATELEAAPFMVFVRRMEIDYVRPVLPHVEITITSFVREFRGTDAIIECTMADGAGKTLSRCLMTATYIDRPTTRPADWPAETRALFYQGGAG